MTIGQTLENLREEEFQIELNQAAQKNAEDMRNVEIANEVQKLKSTPHQRLENDREKTHAAIAQLKEEKNTIIADGKIKIEIANKNYETHADRHNKVIEQQTSLLSDLRSKTDSEIAKAEAEVNANLKAIEMMIDGQEQKLSAYAKAVK